MQTPTQAERDEAARHGGKQDVNDQMQSNWPCLTTIEAQPSPAPLAPPRTLTIAAWNIERCKRVEDSADLLRAAGADIVLATEMDLGMSRSGQRHTTRDLASCLGMGYVYGTEFVELGTGDPYETSLFENVPSENGLHGNAILSRYPLLSPVLIPLDAGGLWFVTQPKNDGQLRIGGRMAMAAQIETANGLLTISAAHYESESTPETRAEQTRLWLDGLLATYGDGPAVIGGDLNTNALTDGSRTTADIVANPAPIEPAFDVFAGSGFDWRASVDRGVTTRAAPGKPVRYPLQVLDWILTRGVAPFAPRIWPALSASGRYLSDHELLTVRIDP